MSLSKGHIIVCAPAGTAPMHRMGASSFMGQVFAAYDDTQTAKTIATWKPYLHGKRPRLI